MVNHLLFADDSLLFFKADDETAVQVQEVLDVYCRASGQSINLDKSSIFFSKGCPEGRRNGIKEMLSVQCETLTEKYLGMPTNVGRDKNEKLQYIKDSLWKKVQGWIERTMSAAGKDVIIKSVAQTIPTYSMSCFKLP